MAESFNFQPFARPVVSAPTGAFSALIEQRLDQFKQGELITDSAKEAFGNLEVAPGDQPRRNRIADSLDSDLDTLLEQYDGGYESIQFQRDAKKLIRDYSSNPSLGAMQDTRSEIEFEEGLRREAARNPSMVLYDFKPEGIRNTSYDIETDTYIPYKTGLETAQNHLKDAQDHMGNLIPNMGEITPEFEVLKNEGMKGLMAIKQGNWKGITKQRVRNRSQQVVDDFAISSNGGNQMARKFAFDNNLGDIFDENGDLKTEIAGYLADYLFKVGSNQVHSQINSNYSFPASLNRDSKTKSLFGSAVTNAALGNNPAAEKFQKLEPTDLEGRGLLGTAGNRLNQLRTKWNNSLVTDGITFSQDELDEFNKLRDINSRIVDSDGLTSYIKSFQKADGSFDRKSFEDTHRGLFKAYESTLKDSGVDPIEALDGGIDPRFFNSLDERVLDRYNSMVDNSMVVVGKGYDLSEDDVKDFKRNYIGDIGTAGFGRISNMGFVDQEGETTTFAEIADDKGFDLENPDEAKTLKTSIQLVQNLIPLFNNGVAQVNIAGENYTLTSDEHAKTMKAGALSQAGPVLFGEVDQSQDVELPFMINPLSGQAMTGRFVANHVWDPDTDEYKGNGVGFVTQDPKNPNGQVFYPLADTPDTKGVISLFLETSNFYSSQ